MKIICAVLLAVIFSFGLHAQTNFPLRLANNQVNLSNNIYNQLDSGKTRNKALEHFPFQFGAGLCYSSWGPESNSMFGGIGYININLWNKTVLLKTEYGLLVSSLNYPLTFLSLSGQYKFADIKNLHKFYGGLGICGLIGKEAGGGGYFADFKYLYASTEDLGVTAGFRIFAPGKDLKNVWRIFLFEAGIQIFH